jgi:chemotaxis protein MotA
MAAAAARRRTGVDVGSIAALPLGIGVVLLAQYLDGGSLESLVQVTAALIVGGGTLAATLVSYSPRDVVSACRAAVRGFRRVDHDTTALTRRVLGLAVHAHRGGVMALEAQIDSVDDPFLRNGLGLAVDGASADALRDILSAEMHAQEAEDEAPARVFEAAAGYAPTLGIVGAVLGLIHVMEHLEAPGALGSGIAVAFVSTLYGIGVANLVLLPLASRLRERAADAARHREIMIEALVAMQQRTNPRLVAQKMRALAPEVAELSDSNSRAAARPRPVKSA